jgi:2,4-dienoyl-CoA reductase-like NADH-dependent reductase (Old Yellow Enzyme family)
MSRSIAPLFRPFALSKLSLANRVVMAPMTRQMSPGGIPGPEVAAYYRRRAESGTGLIITEGTVVDDPVSTMSVDIPNFYGPALDGWLRVVDAVHEVGGKIMPQLWHVGMARNPAKAPHPELPSAGPSGLTMRGFPGLTQPGLQHSEPMTREHIRRVVEAFGQAAADAQRLGFDGVEIHGAHGYLIDQ